MEPLDRRDFLRSLAATAAGVGGLGVAGQGAIAAGGAAPPDGAKDTAALVAGNNRFGCELYAVLAARPDNVFLSPFSISTALAMTALGARGQTAAEMNQVLHLPDEPAPAFGALIKSLNEGDPAKRGFTLSTANALWAQQGYPWRPEYKTLITQQFGAGLFDVDFITQPEGARGTINKWVEQETREKIKDLLAPGTVTRDTRLVLTNAIYFKGNWQATFPKEATKDQPFTLIDGQKVTTPLMYRKGGYRYAENDQFQTLELPYAGRRLSMVVILPRRHDGLVAVEKELSVARLQEVIQQLRHESEVHVYLPRFRIEASYSLNEPLQKLGMRQAFDFAAADFSGMHTGGERLAISAVVHKSFVDVNEEGTEAAAATGVVVGVTSAPLPRTPRHFRADRPFLFLIRDNASGSVLFMGRLLRPTPRG